MMTVTTVLTGRARRRPKAMGAAPLAALCALLALICLAAVPQGARAEAAQGAFVWSAPWSFGTTDSSFVVDLVKGPSGTVYAAGSTGYGQVTSTAFVARLRTSDGSQVWRKTRAGVYLAAAASDPGRNVVIAGNKGGDIAIVKYRASDGKVLWSRTWGGTTTTEYAHDLTIARDGSIYVAGARRTSSTRKDAVVVCLSPGGAVRWRHLTATKGDDIAEAVTTDAAGRCYVTGGRQGEGDSMVWTTYQLSPAGKRLWLRNVTFVSSDTFGEGLWLRVRDDALYVVAQRGTVTPRFAAQKLTPGGKERWLTGSYALPAAAYFNDATVDSTGRLYMVGSLRDPGTPGVASQGVLVVTRAGGAVAWHDAFENPLGDFSTTFDGVAVDASGRAYCAGSLGTAMGDVDQAAVVVRYEASAGIETIWRWDGGAGGGNGFGPLLRDSVVVVGGQATTAGGSRAVVHRLRQ